MKGKFTDTFLLLAPIVLFFISITCFWFLQHHRVFNLSVGKYGYTYYRIDNPEKFEVIKVTDQPYQKITDKNLLNWDADGYIILSKEFHSLDKLHLYAFFPMFPFLLKLFHIPVHYIFLFNFLLFFIGYIFLLKTVKNNDPGYASKKWVWLVMPLLPSLTVMVLPYTEATAFIAMCLGIFFLLRKNILFTLLFFAISAWCRPNILMLILSSFFALGLYAFKYKNLKDSFYILKTLITGLVIGLVSLFAYFYSTSGDFFVFFEAQKVWGTKFQLPKFPFVDYSTESFIIDKLLLLVIAPLAIIRLLFFILKKNSSGSLWDYVILLSYIYYIMSCLIILFFQGGNLHSLHRYTLASPLGFILLADLFTGLKTKANTFRLILYVCVLLASAIIIYTTDNQVFSKLYHNADRFIFANIGTFIFVAILSVIYWSPAINNKRQLIVNACLIALLFIMAAFWDSFLYNQFLCRAWLWL